MQFLQLTKGHLACKLPLRGTLLSIARLGMQYGFEVKVVYDKWELNPTDPPSRGKQKTSRARRDHMAGCTLNNSTVHLHRMTAAQQSRAVVFSQVAPPGSPQRILYKTIWQDLAGKVLRADAPCAELDTILDTIVAAWRFDPINTVATVVVPKWTTARRYRKYIRRKRSQFQLPQRYEPGLNVFRWKNASLICQLDHGSHSSTDARQSQSMAR